MDDIRGMLEFPCDVERLPDGNTLIADAGDEEGLGSEVMEVNQAGEVVWLYDRGLRFAHSAKRLPGGTTLIADTLNNRVLEVTRAGDTVFSSELWGGGTGTLSDGSGLGYPNDAHQLADGTLLITDRNNNRCLIADKSGNLLWQYAGSVHHPHNADMLANGNILLANSDKDEILEIDRAGKTVWRCGGGEPKLSFPRDADRLPNGNTLIADSRHHRVIEVDAAGKIVWEYRVGYYASFYEADSLANGNVLISDQHHHQVLEVNRRGEIVWKFRNKRFHRRRFPRLTNGFFKRVGPDGIPDGWYLYTRFAEGGGSYLSGENQVGLEFDRHGILCLVQYLDVAEGERYTFSGSIRTEDIEQGAFACFQAFFLDDYGGPVCNTIDAPKSTMLTGSNDWREETFTAGVPPGAKGMEFRIMINGKGRVFAKNLMMLK